MDKHNVIRNDCLCGGRTRITSFYNTSGHIGFDLFYVGCEACNRTTAYHPTKKNAIDDWNNRNK